MSLKERWVTALLSGNYSQNNISTHLYHNHKFSCIGVACNVFNIPCRIIREEADITDIYYGIDQEEFAVPKELKELFKANADTSHLDLDEIAKWDKNLSFKEIAFILINNCIYKI